MGTFLNNLTHAFQGIKFGTLIYQFLKVQKHDVKIWLVNLTT